MNEQTLDLRGTPVITADNQTILVNTVLRYRIVDPVRVVYEIFDYRLAVAELVMFGLRNDFGGRSRDEALASRADAVRGLLAQIGDRARAWGIELLGATVDPSPS
jgi:regulator of protease activity HflC (stomatin/prohibitin superfamily)